MEEKKSVCPTFLANAEVINTPLIYFLKSLRWTSLIQHKAKLVCILTFHCFFTLLLESGVGVGLLLPLLYLCGAATCPPLELFGVLAM